jgi:hypothetical protein
MKYHQIDWKYHLLCLIADNRDVDDVVLTMEGGPYQEYFYIQIPIGSEGKSRRWNSALYFIIDLLIIHCIVISLCCFNTVFGVFCFFYFSSFIAHKKQWGVTCKKYKVWNHFLLYRFVYVQEDGGKKFHMQFGTQVMQRSKEIIVIE